MQLKTKWHSWCTGRFSEGCAQCVQGRKTVLFIMRLCAQRCFYCPVSEKKFDKDVVFANEWEIKDPVHPVELGKEAELTRPWGAGITGGDLLVRTDKCCTYIRKLKAQFGKRFHIHLYTPLKLVTTERLSQLSEAGLDEIRFHPNLDDDTMWDRLKFARAHPWRVGIEIPAIPGYDEKIKKLIDYASGMVDFINFNELERSDTQASHYQLDALGYKQRGSISYGIKGSKEIVMPLLTYARRKGLAAHFCTAQLKDGVQMRQRMMIRAANIGFSFDERTEDGLLRRGILYVPEMVPSFGYREKIKTADRAMILPELARLKKKVDVLCEVMIDTKKLRLIVPVRLVHTYAARLKKIGLVPAIVEEYPTGDAIDVTIDFV